MAINDAFQSAAKAALEAFSGINEDFVYVAQGSTVYDASSGVASATDTRYVTSGIFIAYEQKEVDGARVKPTDLKCLIAALNINVNPEREGHIVRVESAVSTTYDIMDKKIDPAGALWELQLRRGT